MPRCRKNSYTQTQKHTQSDAHAHAQAHAHAHTHARTNIHTHTHMHTHNLEGVPRRLNLILPFKQRSHIVIGAAYLLKFYLPACSAKNSTSEHDSKLSISTEGNKVRPLP